jgi:hypothetical protein
MKGTNRLSVKRIALILFFAICLAVPVTISGAELSELEGNFKGFLQTYVKEIKQGNRDYLAAIHPNLPEEMYDFFIDVTRNMMKYSDEKGLSPEITCRDYNICKATWTQPDGSWAAQTFILHEGKWLWLEY